MSYRAITEVFYTRGLIHGKVVINGPNAGLTLRSISNADAAFAEMIIGGIVAGHAYYPA